MSPNWDTRPAASKIECVVLHYTGMQSAGAALERLCDPLAKVSAHYLIDEDGTLYRLVDEQNRAWHAGVSVWQGRENLNHRSIGIELVNPGHEFGYQAFPAPQISVLLDLLFGIRQRHIIPTSGFIGHSDIAPDRKQDPGELFPWKKLAENGYGLWSDLDGANRSILVKNGESGPIYDKLNKQLGMVGYNVSNSLFFDKNIECALSAFQAHWRPELSNGCFDEGTALILDDIAFKTVQIGRS
ncbi:MAG: N-acetylmuramoyl-L-alanine amidase [Kordiimonadaceae bacterium]|nr:N-acetylmuramoyl-L-alanine amidase [Kordiimonadaceae bacterium]